MSAGDRYAILDFERQADPAGEWIPLAVRMKLDLAACKIALSDWQASTPPARAALVELPVETDGQVRAFRERLDDLLAAAGASAALPLAAARLTRLAEWREPGPVPSAVAVGLERVGRIADWGRLDRFGRYVVCSLARKDDLARLAAALDELFAPRPSAR